MKMLYCIHYNIYIQQISNIPHACFNSALCFSVTKFCYFSVCSPVWNDVAVPNIARMINISTLGNFYFHFIYLHLKYATWSLLSLSYKTVYRRLCDTWRVLPVFLTAKQTAGSIPISALDIYTILCELLLNVQTETMFYRGYTNKQDISNSYHSRGERARICVRTCDFVINLCVVYKITCSYVIFRWLMDN